MLNDLLWVSPWFTQSGERAIREGFKEEAEYGLRLGRIWQGLMGSIPRWEGQYVQRLRAEKSKAWMTETLYSTKLCHFCLRCAGRSHFPDSLAVQLGHVSELWTTEYGSK